MAQAQLRQLIDRAQWPSIELRVLTFDQGLHLAMGASFSLLSFPEGLLGDVAYQEYAVGGDVIDDVTVVSQLGRLFGKLRDQALGPDESEGRPR